MSAAHQDIVKPEEPEYPIPTDWMLGSLADVAALPSQFATDHQRTLLDSAHLFAHHADHLPALARAVDTLHSQHLPALNHSTQSTLAALAKLTSVTPSESLSPVLDQINAQLSLLHSLDASQPDLQLILNVPNLLARAVSAIHPDTANSNPAADPLGSLVDSVFSLLAALSTLDRRMTRRGSIPPLPSAARSSSVATSPTSSNAHLPAAAATEKQPTTIALLVARARAIVATDLHEALLAHLTLPTSPLPTLLRSVAHLRRLDPSPNASLGWAHAFLASRLARLPPPPTPTPSGSGSPEADGIIPTPAALAWLDSVRGHMFDTWAHARVVFPDCHVHPLALHAARGLREDLAHVLRGVAPQDLAGVARHAHSAWGTACRRLGWDLSVPVVRPVVDGELVRRLEVNVERAVQVAVRAAAGGEAAAAVMADPDRPETWSQASRPLTAFAAHIVEAVNAATFPRIPVAKLGHMARVLAEALRVVEREVVKLGPAGEVQHVWAECIVPHLVRSWDKVVEAAGIRGDETAQVRLRLDAHGVAVGM